MKISIGTKIKDGPWGGGNLFAINLKNYLENNSFGFFIVVSLSIILVIGSSLFQISIFRKNLK